jgi:hypothetical protein
MLFNNLIPLLIPTTSQMAAWTSIVCGPTSGPKCNGGSPVCSVVMVAVGGCCGLLSLFDTLFVLVYRPFQSVSVCR